MNRLSILRRVAAASLLGFMATADGIAQNPWSASYASSNPTFGNSSCVLDNGLVCVGDPGYTVGVNRFGQVLLFSPTSATPLKTYTGSQHWGDFGAWVSQVGDIDNDQRNDFVIGEPGAGKVWVVSGLAPFNLIYPAPLAAPSIPGVTLSSFGTRVVSVGDLNGDNFDDLAISATSSTNGQGYVCVFTTQSVASMTFRYSLTVANGAGAMHTLTELGAHMHYDAPTSTLLVAAPLYLSGANPSYVREGAIVAFRGLNGTGTGLPAPVVTQMPTPTPDAFGSGLANLGDLDGDGKPEWVAGADFHYNPSGSRGLLAYFSTGSNAFTYCQATAAQFGLGFNVRQVEDIDWDGIRDVVTHDVNGTLHVVSSRTPHATIFSKSGYRIAQIGTGPNISDVYQNGADKVTVSGVNGSTAFLEMLDVAGSMNRGGGCSTVGAAATLSLTRPVLTQPTFQLDVTSANPLHANQIGVLAIGTTAPGQYPSAPWPFCAGTAYVVGAGTIAFLTSATGSYPQSISTAGLAPGFCAPLQAVIFNPTSGGFDLTNAVFVTAGTW